MHRIKDTQVAVYSAGTIRGWVQWTRDPHEALPFTDLGVAELVAELVAQHIPGPPTRALEVEEIPE